MEAGINRQAACGNADRKVPSGLTVACHEVVPVRPLTVIVTSSSGRKPAPHTTAPTRIGRVAIG
jgi:hypothetical protein